MTMAPPPDLSSLSLAEIVQAMEAQKLPPVAHWNPTHCGDSEMRIARDGTWFHQGSVIARPAMVRVFSTILRREPDGRHVLVTPVEKLDIAVEDAPFVATALKVEGEGREGRLVFQLNTGDLIAAGSAHPLRFVDGEDGPRPYLHVRDGLEALIARPVYYELADRALVGDDQVPGVWSDGIFFPMTTPALGSAAA